MRPLPEGDILLQRFVSSSGSHSLSMNHSRLALQNVRQLTGRNTRPHVHDQPQQTPTPPRRLFPLPTPTSSTSSPNSRPTSLRPTRCSSTPSAYAATTTLLTALTTMASTATTPHSPCFAISWLAPKAAGMLPQWWNEEKQKECELVAMEDEHFNIKFAVEKPDIQEYYKDNMMPMTLRMVA